MKKILLVLAGSFLITSLNAQKIGTSTRVRTPNTITKSNKAIFDGENLISNEKILIAGGDSVGSTLSFGANESLNYGPGAYKFDILGGNESGLIFDHRNSVWGNITTLDLKSTGFESFFTVSDQAWKTILALPKANSQLIIGESINFYSNSKLVVHSGNSYFDGNVGIGTETHIDPVDNQEYKLSVDGKIRADAIKVYTTWADYVFENNYNLLSLEEVDTFIKKNGHLKDIPSAAVVENNGIDLGNMNKLLLQKIEELTLYLIDHQNTINKLQEDIKTLKKQVNEN